MRSELLKTHVKPDNSKETVGDVVTETRAIDSVTQTNKLIAGLSKGIDKKRSNMIYPQFRIVAPRIHWKQKYTALQQILLKHITFSNIQAKVSIRHCLQLVIPCQSTLYGHFSQLQRWYGPPSSYIKC